ncbi:MAG TPA: HAD-IB family phosphatase [Lacunisphaera sp.]|nr:HAD-IB family phosphatase [Lacunisphaera sp.]
MANSPTKLLCLDCDSTLSAIEGVDELARLRGPVALAAVAQMTNDAMDGKIPLEQVFARRLEIIRPGRAETEAVGRQYVETVEPTAVATVSALKAAGWTPVIVSAGYTQAIEPLARLLGIARVEAVRLEFDAQGNYAGFDTAHPATRKGGKPEIVRTLKTELKPARSAAVGDGVSDLETRGEVDLFVGFGRYAERAQVKAAAPAFIYSLSELLPLLQ